MRSSNSFAAERLMSFNDLRFYDLLSDREEHPINAGPQGDGHGRAGFV
jgi:hypothetical protein